MVVLTCAAGEAVEAGGTLVAVLTAVVGPAVAVSCNAAAIVQRGAGVTGAFWVMGEKVNNETVQNEFINIV